VHRSFRFAALLLAALALGAASAPVPPVGPADMVLGRRDAPVTVIEYGSLTCPHCAAFEQAVFPRLKTEWVDTGKLRFVFRDYPRDRADLQAFQLTHCGGNEHFWPLLDSLYQSQAAWSRQPNPAEDLVRLGKRAGLPEAKGRACLADQSLARASTASLQGGDRAGVDGTPSFFLNGRKVIPWSYEDWQKLLSEPAGQP